MAVPCAELAKVSALPFVLAGGAQMNPSTVAKLYSIKFTFYKNIWLFCAVSKGNLACPLLTYRYT